MKVSDYIAQYLLDHDINQVFCVTGGWAMHLNDSFGRKLNVMYHNGEINCGYSALGWASVDKKPCVVCTTSGCGSTNAITPCLSAWQDSIPVFFISGSVNHKENLRAFNNSVRAYSGSDADVITMVQCITKLAVEVRDPEEIGNIMEQCFWTMMNGRKGPVWLSVPLDIQAMETSGKVTWTPPIPPPASSAPVEIPLATAKRPVIIIGGGIRECIPKFLDYVKKTNIPFVKTYLSIDVPGAIGRVGVYGDRNGNTIVQKSDLVIVLGCRLAHCLIGYKGIEYFAPEAKIFQVEIDPAEFHQKRVEYIHADCNDFLDTLPVVDVKPWFEPFPVERPNKDPMNPYTLLDNFFKEKPAGTNVVFSSGTLQSLTWHTAVPKEDDRIIVCTHGDMGYEIPASIGVALKTGRRTFCLLGDGSFQFTIGELMNLKNLPVTVLCFDNGGYAAINITQNRYFKDGEFGTKFEFPDFKKLADVYNLPYYTEFVNVEEGPALIHLKCKPQGRYPVVAGLLDNFVEG